MSAIASCRNEFKKLLGGFLPFMVILVLLGLGIHISFRIPPEGRKRRDVTADDAEIYENAAVAADTITCSEVGKNFVSFCTVYKKL